MVDIGIKNKKCKCWMKAIETGKVWPSCRLLMSFHMSFYITFETVPGLNTPQVICENIQNSNSLEVLKVFDDFDRKF